MPSTYEPISLDDFAFSNPRTEKILKALLSKTPRFPSDGTTGILLHGTWGTGKTTLARLLPILLEKAYGNQQLFADESMYYSFFSCEQGQRGDLLFPEIHTQIDMQWPSSIQAKIVVLDEVDNLSEKAQNSLKAVMNRQYFGCIMTTNSITKVNKAICDRSYVLDMDAPPPKLLLPLLRKVATNSGWTDASDEALVSIAGQTRGSYREAIRLVGIEAIAAAGAVAA